MILVGQYDSPYVRRVAVTLHLYGFPFDRNPISVFVDAEKMASINPLVRIPSLVLGDGEVLFDSAAIVDYLDELAGPDLSLTPRAGKERRRVLQATVVAAGGIDKAGAVVYERHFHEGDHLNLEWEARCKRQLGGALTFLEGQLTSEWLTGPKMTQADVITACLVGYLKLRLPEVLRGGEYPGLERLSDACEKLEAFTASRPSPEEVMPPR
ncbi:MAG: glutathione S-transferase family protein [Polyangiaceae bacterium]